MAFKRGLPIAKSAIAAMQGIGKGGPAFAAMLLRSIASNNPYAGGKTR
jgi:hypothetical protein